MHLSQVVVGLTVNQRQVDLGEVEASLACRASFRIARAILRNLVSKNQTKDFGRPLSRVAEAAWCVSRACSPVSVEVGLCRKHAPSDHRASQEASQLDSSLRIYWSRRYWSSTVCDAPGIVQSRCQLGQEK